jgi:hypothetical protein
MPDCLQNMTSHSFYFTNLSHSLIVEVSNKVKVLDMHLVGSEGFLLKQNYHIVNPLRLRHPYSG